MKKASAKRRLGMVGCGAIGSLVAQLLQKRKTSFQVSALWDVNTAAADRLSFLLKPRPLVCANLLQMITKSDLVLEAASVAAASKIAEACLKRHKPVILMSTGGFLLNQNKLTRLAEHFRTKIYLPSGALCGLDGVRAARQWGPLRELELTSTKHPKGFLGAPGLTSSQEKALLKLEKPLKLYKGDVWGAIKRFPANVNVGATLAVASLAPRKLRVRVVADPRTRLNQHEVRATGSFGELTAVTRNRPSRENPKTSALAIQAVLALLERLESFVEVGN